MARKLRVLKGYVLVQQTMTSKSSVIILDRAKVDNDKFNFKFEIMEVGKGCEQELRVGEEPIFAEHVRFQGIKVVEKTNLKMVSLVIVHENDIIAVEEEIPEEKSETTIDDLLN